MILFATVSHMVKEDFSLFDPGAHKKKRTPKIESPSPSKKPSEPKEPIPSDTPMTTSEMVSKIAAMQSDLQVQIETVAKLIGKDLQMVKKFLSNKANFTEKEWQAIELHREMISNTLGVKSKEVVKKEKKSQETRKMTQGRKGKTLGARRRWIDMR